MTVARIRVWLSIIISEVGKIPEYHREGERMLRALRAGDHPRPHDRRVRFIRREPNHDARGRSIAMSFWLLAIIAVSVPGGAEASVAVRGDSVRILAENVLGPGTVVVSRITEDGAQVLMRWESVTYKPAHNLAATREFLYSEALLATGMVMSELTDVNRVRFTILRKGQMLATGENWRGRGVTMVFAPQIGGGPARPTRPVRDPARPGSGEPAREL
jgi:hypothetical protein